MLQQLVDDSKKNTRTDRIFVLDTNVLIHDPKALFSFKGVVVGIPFIVLEELDTFKREPGEKGHNVREVIRQLDILRKQGRLVDGVLLNNGTEGAIVKILQTPHEITFSIASKDVHDIKDNAIIQTVANLVKEGNKVTLVTKDINVRIKADALGFDAEDYIKNTVLYDQFYKGWTSIIIPNNEFKNLVIQNIKHYINTDNLLPNQFIIVYNDTNTTEYRLFRNKARGGIKEVLPITLLHVFTAKNVQQLMALDLLLDDDIQLLTLIGPAGTGKTFLALLAGLYKVAYAKLYRKFLVTRPVIALGNDIGFLPGNVQEKLHYWMQPIHDNLEFIASQMLQGTEEYLGLSKKRKRHHDDRHDSRDRHYDKKHGNDRADKSYRDDKNMYEKDDMRQLHGKWATNEKNITDKLYHQGIISLEAITYMRGRSIPFQYVLIDEVQNLTPHEVKTLISRAGEGTKIILAGDPSQIDSPYLDFSSNGLTVTSEKCKQYALFGTVFLETSERSALAKLAADIL